MEDGGTCYVVIINLLLTHFVKMRKETALFCCYFIMVSAGVGLVAQNILYICLYLNVVIIIIKS